MRARALDIALCLLVALAPACGRTFLSATTHGPALQAGHPPPRHIPRGPTLYDSASAEGAGGASMLPVAGGVPHLELAPETYAAEQQEKAVENQRAAVRGVMPLGACAPAGQEIVPVAGHLDQQRAQLDGDLARIETEVAVIQRAESARQAVPDAQAVLGAARDASDLGHALGAVHATDALLAASSTLASSVEAGDAARSSQAIDSVLAADSAVRRAVHLPR